MSSRPSDILKLSMGPMRRAVMLVPATAAIAGYGIGLVIGPTIESAQAQQRWSGFFGTSAQVIATLLLALALEARFVSRAQLLPRARWAHLAVGYVALGELAAVTGLSPSLSPCLYTQAFALTVGGGIGALVTVMLIGARALTSEYHELEEALVDRFARRLDELSPGGEETGGGDTT